MGSRADPTDRDRRQLRGAGGQLEQMSGVASGLLGAAWGVGLRDKRLWVLRRDTR